MKQIESIKENYEFRRVYKRGKSSADSFLAVYLFRNYKKVPRLGVTVSNKIAKAVGRNKIRRRIKGAFHLVLPSVKTGVDIVVVARTKASLASYTQIESSLHKHLKKLGVLDEQNSDKNS
ncbi:MAG: ribonuclease P protein component [Clostridia bacterium]